MSSILASVSVVLGAELSEFKAKMAEARRELSGLVKFSEGLKDIGKNLTTYVTAPLLALGTGAVLASGKIEGLRNALNAINTQDLAREGTTGLGALAQAAQLTRERMKELEVLARQPGLGFEQAVQGDVRLRAVSISAEQSGKSLKAFANAIALTGGGKSELAGVTVQLAQLSAKGKVLAQDLRPIIEAAPAVSGALQKLYGTVDSETISASLKKQGQSSTDFIRVLTDELGKLPQVAGSLKNGLENFGDTATLTLAKIGDGISKALNLPAVLAGVSDYVTRIGDSFANLSPGAQRLIVALAGVAAAAGPVFVALGTLGAAAPAVIAGFALLKSGLASVGTGFAALLTPTGAVIAVLATLTAVVYAASTANERAYQSFVEQSAATQKLATDLNPLLDRYDELKSKAELSAAEQDELKGIIEQVTSVLPDAGKGFDSYGKAIELSTGKARAFIAQNQELDRTIALKSLPAQLDKLRELQAEYDRVAKKRDEVTSKGTFNGVNVDDLGTKFLLEFRTQVGETTTALEEQKKRVADLRAAVNGLGGAYEDASVAGAVFGDSVGSLAGALGQQVGLLAELEEKLKAAKEAKPNLTTEDEIAASNRLIASLEAQIKRLNELGIGSKKAQDALAKLAAELRGNAELSAALGSNYDALGERLKIIEAGLKSLVLAGVSPASAKFKELVAEALRLKQTLGDNATLIQKFYKNADLRRDAPQLELADPFSDTSQLDKAGGRNPYERPTRLAPLDVTPITEPLKVLSEAQQNALLRQTTFNTQMEGLITSLGASIGPLLADFAGQFGDAFGSIITGTAAAGDAMTQLFAGVLGSLGSFMGEFGKQLITIGVGKLALDTLFTGPQGGPLAIAAGLGLVALAGVAKSIASSASGSLSNVTGGGNYGGGSGSNYGQATPAQQTVKVIAEFKLRGEDLVAVGRMGAYRNVLTD
ncbi:tape measure protein [Hymenobacter convexus]|uniref:tape measure protein n=1 Tax=Hymenobacter sp. CA1UV-4 TaxID=3063782 RepID=UPI0027125E71|nr:tape measure protein [Hymenobacter sp. CA1UV-4]MDO7851402.1 tape measure protein [Hymenobacter sp. CA1UV-4]